MANLASFDTDSVSLSSPSPPAPHEAIMSNSMMIAELPSETPHVVASSIKAIQAVVRRHSGCSYVVIDYVAPDIIERLVDSPRLRVIKSSKLFYNADLRKLVIKIPSNVHEVGSINFNRLLDRHLLLHSLDNEVTLMGSARVQDGEYSKEADQSYSPARQIPGRSMKWPTVVLEVGYSESLRRLRVDARWWLGRSRGLVRIALLLSIDRSCPRIIIEKWENSTPTHGYDLRAQTSSQHRTAEVIVAFVQGGFVITGSPLTISADDMLMYPTPTNVTVQIDNCDLIRLSRKIWEFQGFVNRPQAI